MHVRVLTCLDGLLLQVANEGVAVLRAQQVEAAQCNDKSLRILDMNSLCKGGGRIRTACLLLHCQRAGNSL